MSSTVLIYGPMEEDLSIMCGLKFEFASQIVFFSHE